MEETSLTRTKNAIQKVYRKTCKRPISHHLKSPNSLLPLWSLIFLASSSDGVCSDTFTSGTVMREQSEGVSATGSDQQCDLARLLLSDVSPDPAPVRTCLQRSICYWVSGCRIFALQGSGLRQHSDRSDERKRQRL